MKKLLTHHQAKIDENFSVLDRAIIEHNISAISKIYDSIKIDSMSQILQIQEIDV